MEDEMEGLWGQGAFTEEPLPHDKAPVNTRFIYKIKRTADGAVEIYKARLVARGFTQRKGIDFFETFSPVVGFDVMRTVLATAALRKWRVGMLDFTQAYLNAPLLEGVWLQLPDKSVVKADKAIYGLKQSAVQWFKELRSTIPAEDWHSSHYDECLYYCQAQGGRVAILVTYVDDLLFSGDYTEEIQRMQTCLLARFKGRDLGVPDSFSASVSMWPMTASLSTNAPMPRVSSLKEWARHKCGKPIRPSTRGWTYQSGKKMKRSWTPPRFPGNQCSSQGRHDRTSPTVSES
ncbi:unnamed protein product [Sphacelaria rigidula]